jgi:hypothetical protein
MTYSRINHFSDIESWKLGREIRQNIYEMVSHLPRFEIQDLASQMRRAAVSVTANIAEGQPGYCMSKSITRPDRLPHAALQKIS